MYSSRISIIVSMTALFASALAMPATLVSRQDAICSSGNPQCCDTDVLGVADLDCETPPAAYTDAVSFNKVCADVGKIDMCCDLPILDQGLICSSPSGS
ncbi:putative hydrophobin protein [Botrytis fragariae]|uniref:Putative hydrophobin protein n=1 Tax=Botrytis fragariae TaxID=1964551 RepID=A0A8H6AI18_9HELO|nr:putative hydrophobin protein [Botrytis fragariae]KAF5867598.1 putative hydrophobin protein [Botrytis fragariae]